MSISLESRSFGCLPSGEQVDAWTLTGECGLVVEVITYGGIVTRLLAPDRDGKLDDVVLGFNHLDNYLPRHPYFGAITGRVAGRITGAAFTLDGKRYELACNNPPNHLHGGLVGFDKRLWSASPAQRADGAPSLRLAYRSPDGEEGYPGTVDVTVTYTVTHDNAFLIETEASTDRPTPINLTNHSYFNLAGEGSGTIDDHLLQIFAEEYVPTDDQMTLLGRVESVAGQGNDFRQPRRMGDAIPHLHRKHGDAYVLRENFLESPEPLRAARLVHPATGRVLEVSTTDTYLQLYTSAFLDGSLVGKSSRTYAKHGAVCLECHGYSDGANTSELGDIILRPGKPQRRATSYAFSAQP